MGYMKRLVDWRLNKWPIPQPIQAFVGLVPYRDPEAYLEKKRAEREAAAERRAIQAVEIAEEKRLERIEADPEQPQLAAAGWYRVGSTFYRLGSGPFPLFWATHQRKLAEENRPTRPTLQPPAKHQLSLFN